MKTSKILIKNRIVALVTIISVAMVCVLLANIVAELTSSLLTNLGVSYLVAWVVEGVILFVVSLLIVWAALHFLSKKDFSVLGFDLKTCWFADVLIGTAIAFVIISIGTAFILLTNNAEIRFFTDSRVDYLLCSFVIIIFAAAAEEVLFRGYFLNVLTSVYGKNIAILISALIFSVFHLLNPDVSLLAFLNIFIAGILLGLLYVRKMNLWLPIVFHAVWNFLQSILGYSVSGSGMPSIFTLEYSQTNLINGGEFGFEGSVVCTVLLLTTTIFVYCKTK